MTSSHTHSDNLWVLPAHWVIAAPIAMMDGDLSVLLGRILSDEEKTRSLKFRQESDRNSYLLAHGLKRFALSKLLGIEANLLKFSTGEKGKPLCDDLGAPMFNLSHSGEWVLCGVSSISSIGVDVEIANREVSDAVANYSLSALQLKDVYQSTDVRERFMLYWTQKEAISKALGLGLSIGFKSLECNGIKGRSNVDYLDHTLTVESRMLDDYVVSVATSSPEQVLFHRLTQWTEDSFLTSAD